jgi:hypothetical protein
MALLLLCISNQHRLIFFVFLSHIRQPISVLWRIGAPDENLFNWTSVVEKVPLQQ